MTGFQRSGTPGSMGSAGAGEAPPRPTSAAPVAAINPSAAAAPRSQYGSWLSLLSASRCGTGAAAEEGACGSGVWSGVGTGARVVVGCGSGVWIGPGAGATFGVGGCGAGVLAGTGIEAIDGPAA